MHPRECMLASGGHCHYLCLAFESTEVTRTFPGKANTHVSWLVMPRSWEEQGMETGIPPVPRHLPMPGAWTPEWCHR